jgi:branched-subunit amino acid transport protein AzlD
MNESALIAIGALCATSVLVRITPVFVSLRLSTRGLQLVGQVMPMAVFVNLAVYVLHSEIGNAPVAGGLALLIVAALAAHGRVGLMGSTLCAAAVYYLLAAYLH